MKQAMHWNSKMMAAYIQTFKKWDSQLQWCEVYRITEYGTPLSLHGNFYNQICTNDLMLIMTHNTHTKHPPEKKYHTVLGQLSQYVHGYICTRSSYIKQLSGSYSKVSNIVIHNYPQLLQLLSPFHCVHFDRSVNC